MADIEKGFFRPLEENFSKINTDRDGYLGKEELAKCQSSAEFSKEVQDSCMVAENNYDGLQTLTSKEWWRHGISKNDLNALRRANGQFENLSELARFGLANFDTWDNDHTGILDEPKLQGTKLSNRTSQMGHVTSTSIESEMTSYNSGMGMSWHMDYHSVDHYGISKSDLQTYPQRLLSGQFKTLGGVLNGLPVDH